MPEPSFSGVVEMVRIAVLWLKECCINLGHTTRLQHSANLRRSRLGILKVFEDGLTNDCLERVIPKWQPIGRSHHIRHRISEDVYLNDIVPSLELAPGTEVQHPAITVVGNYFQCRRTIGVTRYRIIRRHGADTWLGHALGKQNGHTRSHRVPSFTADTPKECRGQRFQAPAARWAGKQRGNRGESVSLLRNWIGCHCALAVVSRTRGGNAREKSSASAVKLGL